MSDRHRKAFEKEEREQITEQDFDGVMEAMLGPKASIRNENKEPTAKELNRRFRLSQEYLILEALLI